MFDSLPGQERIKKVLSRAIETGQVGHAYLFSGSGEIGPDRIAKAFAAALVCTSSENPRPCGRCLSCRQLKDGNYQDYIHIHPEAGAQTIKIRQIRELITRMSQQTYDGGIRICLISEAEKMTAEAQNALLKSLEEPAPGNVFLLTVSMAEKLLPTIRSRCQIMTLTADQDNIGNETIKNEAFSVICDILKKQPFSLFDFSEVMGKDKSTGLQALEGLILIFRDGLKVEKTGVIPDGTDGKMLSFFRQLKTGQAEAVLEVLFEQIERMQYNVNQRLQWERSLLKINEILSDQENMNGKNSHWRPV